MTGAMVGAAAIGAVGSYAASSASAGKGGGAASSTPSSMWQMMPGWAQDKYAAGMQSMPATTNVGFGGQVYPSMYGPYHRAATSIFPPQGANAQGAQPGGFGSALGAAMPWAMMAMNNAGLQGTGLQGYLNTNYYSPALMSSITSGASGYVPGWY